MSQIDLSGLTESQLAAVTTHASETLVIAPAGAGKTRVLTKRIAWLISEGADPSSIMVATFTRKAAQEMRERLAVELGDGRDLEPMTIGTLHSVALSILERHGAALGYRARERLTVYDDDDVNDVLESVCRDLGYLDEQSHWKLGLSGEKIRKYREALATYARELVGGFESATLTALRRLYMEYRHRLKENSALDYGLLLTECIDLLRAKAEVREQYQERIRHVVVDEYQDLSMADHSLLAIFAPPATFFAVGDRRQALYSFRNARPDMMIGAHPKAAILHLEDNFRSCPCIVEAANKLIAVNKDPLAKPMRAARKTGNPGTADALLASLPEVGAKISELLGELYAPGDIAVLARTHEWLRNFEPELIERKIPYVRVGSKFGLTHLKEFKLLESALRLIQNPLDNLAFMRLRAVLKVDAVEYAEIRKQAADHECGHWDAWQQTLPRKEGQPPKLPAVARIVQEYRDRDPVVPLVVAELVGAWSPEASQPWPSIRNYWARFCQHMPVSAALRWRSMAEQEDELEPDSNAVTLATIHAAKGLEWPVVLVIGAQEGVFPHARTDDELLEERRVGYVAVTRAREVLHVMAPTVDGLAVQPKPSRFIDEAGLKLDAGRQPEPAAAVASNDESPAAKRIADELGDLFGGLK